MGNCLHRESSVQWGSDYWGSPPVQEADRFFTASASHEKEEMIVNIEEKTLLDEDNKGVTRKAISSSTATSSTEIKIKITKKQLEELLGRVNMKELSLEQVLAQLMNVSKQSLETNQRSWRPNLQSIPE